MNKTQRFEPLHILRGLLMGAADTVPGVSGGTVALIVGIYERLVTAITHVDRELLVYLQHREWRKAAEHLDLVFLLTLGTGIALGIAALAGLMHYLLEHQRQATLSAFLGLIAASSWLVAKLVVKWRGIEWICLILSGVFAYWLVGLSALSNPPDTLGYVFFCGVIAICAMILPGISGAFILVLLGKYRDILGIVKETIHLRFTSDGLAVVAVFSLGCLIGLLSFARLLKWLLSKHGAPTMAALCGFMIGSLYKLWPFERYSPPVGAVEFDESYFVKLGWSELPEGGEIFQSVVIAVIAAGFVLTLDWLTQRHRDVEPAEHGSIAADATDS